MPHSKRILFIVAHRLGRSPGQRFRFEQYLDSLSQEGYSYDISYIINENDDNYFYNKGHLIKKALILFKSLFIRYQDYKRANEYDIIFIYREALMIGSIFFEKLFKKSGAKIILDFDDAIWLQDVSQANYYLRWLKKPEKTKDIITLADLVIVGNDYLANYASQFNTNTIVVPTTIDTTYYKNHKNKNKNTSVCIGWTGSLTTNKHLETAISVLKAIQEKYGNKIQFVFISDSKPNLPSIDFTFKKWTKETEIHDLSLIDIGIMPLPDDDWSKGKCGFKGLQYMALGIPTIMSPVGVNTEIIQHDINGFLAQTTEEWISLLSELIESEVLRKRLGDEGEKTVLKHYSIISQKDKYLNCFNKILSNTI